MEAKARKLKTKMQKDMLVADSDEEEDFFKAKSKQEARDSSSAEDE